MRGARAAWMALALVAAVLALYAPVGTHAFVGYDDEQYLLENPHLVEGLTPRAVAWFFTHSYAANYHPLTWVSHLADVSLFGLEPGPHHWGNVALHALNAVLCAALLRTLLGSPVAALLGAALFALHPLRVEVVAWAAERKELLCTAFYLSALLAYVRFARRPSAGRQALVLALFALALLSKPMATSFPLVALLLDAFLGRWACASCRTGTVPPPFPARSGRALLLEKLPLFLLAALGAATTLWAQSRAGATSSIAALALELRVLNGLRSLCVYLAQSVLPRGLSVFYPHAALVEAEPARALLPGALAGLVCLAGGAALAWRTRRTIPALALGLGFFLVTLAPVLGLVQVGTQAHADRYTYLPAVGLSLALAGGALALARARAGAVARILPLAGLLAALALAGLARRQLAVWADTRTLFAHALALDERNPLAHTMLGEVALAEGELAAARRSFQRALELQPRDAHVLNKLALCDLAEGAFPAARARLEQALALAPDDVEARVNLAALALELGALEEARARLTEALAREPWNANAHFNLALVAAASGDRKGAEEALQRALALDPRHADAWINLGSAQLGAGRTTEALRSFTRACELLPEDAVAVFNLGVALRQAGERGRAREAFERALALDPGLEPARNALHALAGER